MISVLKRKEILTRGTAWMKLENTVLSEISQYYKLNACVPTGANSSFEALIPNEMAGGDGTFGS